MVAKTDCTWASLCTNFTARLFSLGRDAVIKKKKQIEMPLRI